MIMAYALLCSSFSVGGEAAEPPGLTEVISELQAQETAQRLNAVGTLSFWAFSGYNIDRAIKPLVRTALRDRNEATRLMSMAAIEEIGPRAVSAATSLIEILNDDSPVVAVQAALTLSGLRATIAEKPLQEKLVCAKTETFRLACAYALWRLSPKKHNTVPYIISRGQKGSSLEASLAARLLSRVGDEHIEAIPALVRLLDRTEPEVQRSTLRSLASLGPRGKAALPRLAHVYRKATDDAIKAGVLGVYAKNGANSEPWLEVMMLGMKDERACVRAAAIGAIEALGPRGKPALPILLKLVEEDRQNVIPLVNAIGATRSVDALPALRRLHDKENDVALRYALAEVIKSISDAQATRDREGKTTGRKGGDRPGVRNHFLK